MPDRLVPHGQVIPSETICVTVGEPDSLLGPTLQGKMLSRYPVSILATRSLRLIQSGDDDVG